MAGWHHWLDGRESEWTPGVGDEQGGLACCDSWGRKELDSTERLNWTELNQQNEIRKRNKRKPNCKVRSKTLFTDDVSTPVEIPIESIRKLLEVTHESSKVIDYKIHIKKSTEFLYINNEKNRNWKSKNSI